MKWTSDDINKLQEIVNETINAKVKWKKVSEKMNEKYSAIQCKNKWSSLNGTLYSRPWKKDERNLLRIICTEHPLKYNLPWEVICQHFMSRTPLQCQKEWERIQNLSYKKPRWSISTLMVLRRKGPEYCFKHFKDRTLDSYKRQYRRISKE
jgi:hypothetical protein